MNDTLDLLVNGGITLAGVVAIPVATNYISYLLNLENYRTIKQDDPAGYRNEVDSIHNSYMSPASASVLEKIFSNYGRSRAKKVFDKENK
jgi:hypothetical protein